MPPNFLSFVPQRISVTHLASPGAIWTSPGNGGHGDGEKNGIGQRNDSALEPNCSVRALCVHGARSSDAMLLKKKHRKNVKKLERGKGMEEGTQEGRENDEKVLLKRYGWRRWKGEGWGMECPRPPKKNCRSRPSAFKPLPIQGGPKK